MIARLAQFLTALAVNAVPALGWLIGDWSSGTTLGIYWFENVAASLFIALRIIIHRRMLPLRGHFRYEGPSNDGKRRSASGTFLSGFLPVSLMFSAAHGFFLLVLFFLLTHNGHGADARVNPRELLTGSGLVVLFLAFDFLIDLFTLKKRSFRWLETLANRNLGRVMLVHMTLIIGMGVAAMTGGSFRNFFIVFVVLKTLNDLSVILPQYDPAEPPKWLSSLMDRVPNIGKGKQTFAEFWRDGKRAEVNRLRTNELPLDQAP